MIGAAVGELGSIGQQGGAAPWVPMVGGIPALAGFRVKDGRIQAHNLDFASAFSRNGAATVIDASGNIVTLPSNTPRIISSNLWEMQIASTNRLLNSAVVVAQSFTTTAVVATLSFYGTGSITLSGSATGTLVGTGANNRVSLTFTPSSGTLTITPSGDVRLGQLENLSAATSYIPTAGSPVTRSVDLFNWSIPAALQARMANGFWVGMKGALGGVVADFDNVFQLDNGTTANRSAMYYNRPFGGFGILQAVGGVSQAEPGRAGSLTESLNIAARFAPNNFAAIWWDGAQATDTVAAYTVPTVLRLGASNTASADKPAIARYQEFVIADPAITLAQAEAWRAAA